MHQLLLRGRRLRRRVLARRRLLAAVFAGLAVLAGLRAVSPPPPPRTTVLVATQDLVAGATLAAADVRAAGLDPAAVPAGVLTRPGQALGRTTAGAVRAGETLTDVRLTGPALTAGYPGRVAVPVRLADAGSAALLRVGDRVDLSATDPQGQTSASVVARDVAVLVIPPRDDSVVGLGEGALVLVAVPPEVATAVASATVRGYLSFILRH